MFKKSLIFAVFGLLLCYGCEDSETEGTSGGTNYDYVSRLVGSYDVSQVKVENRDQEGYVENFEGYGTLDIVSLSNGNKINLTGTTEMDDDEESYTISAKVDPDGIIRIDRFKFNNDFKALGLELNNKHREEWDINVTNSTLKLENRCLSGCLEYTAYDYDNEEYHHGTVSVLGYKM